MTLTPAQLKAKYYDLFNREYADCHLIQNWKKQLEQGQNVSIQICGTVRSGKSYVALDIAEAMDYAYQDDDPYKIISQRFTYTAQSLMTQLNKNLPAGSVIVADDVGTAQSGQKSKMWWDEINQALADWLQVGGHNAYLIIMTSPVMKTLQTDSRELMTVYIECNRRGLRKDQGYNSVKVQQIDVKPKMNKTFYPNYVYEGVKVESWNFPYPFTEGLPEAYEKFSTERKELLEKLQGKKIQYLNSKEGQAYLTPQYVAQFILSTPENRKRYLVAYGKNKEKVRINRGLVDADMGGVSDRILQRARALVKYKIEEEGKNDTGG